ncbi:hypothetical protein Strain138_001754 [Pseudogemmatithrix spongiicola]|uniref:Phosphomannose isomerase type I catalytic domain-containing protein n=1 Tax=Pseudogemmatithrix spongiicola TaxID=3062599 RepID=A0AA49Q547_9BACT|nr:hypothetical protein Strain138_001754 [Gemmatimonadaceae bacterium 'strain 138']WKW15368.1 hypothetical protein Strain318_001753 [Gemmatimonadaceae bacterium 'strain 318']
MTADIGPFTLAPLLVPKPWGGRAIEPMLGLPSSDRQIGEAWLCADLGATSPWGAGGQAMVSQVESGWGEGRSLNDLVRAAGPALLGREVDRFPLLIKLLDAERNLSVQVHPSASYAAAHPGAHLKTEAWYTLAARPGAKFLVGTRGISTAAALREAAEREEIGAMMDAVEVAADDAVMIPSGTVHALGAGAVVFEVQTASDATFRLYDWTRETGQASRELQLAQAAAAADLSLTPEWSRGSARAGGGLVFSAEPFVLHALVGRRISLGELGGEGASLLFVRESGAVLETRRGRYALPAGRATIVPASLVAGASIHREGDGTLLTVQVR